MPNNDKELAAQLNSRFRDTDTQEVVSWVVQTWGREAALSSSLSWEDQAVTAMMCHSPREKVRVFTLDTGRLFPECYDLIERTRFTFGIDLEVFFPDYRGVQEMVAEHGVNLFFESVELRHRCCNVRKVEPLKRALKGTKVWITGLRRLLPAGAQREQGGGQGKGFVHKQIQKKGKLSTSHRYNLLPLLPSGPGGVQRELVVYDFPAAKIVKN